MTVDFPLIELLETDSTNRYLMDWCNQCHDQVEPFTVVLSNFQTAGKGQRGNSWESEAGANLTFSLLLYPAFLSAKRQFLISQVVSLGIVEALRHHVGEAEQDCFSVKWPNDIYFRDKKICGILIETNLEGMNLGRCVCGIGLNVNQQRFMSDAPNPVSLAQILGRETDRYQLLHEVVDAIASLYAQLEAEEEPALQAIMEQYADSLYRKTGLHAYEDKGGRFMASIKRVEADGRLQLEDADGHERSYLFKEVQFII